MRDRKGLDTEERRGREEIKGAEGRNDDEEGEVEGKRTKSE